MNALTHWSQVHTKNPYAGFPLVDWPKDVTGWFSDEPVFDLLIHEVRPSLIVEVGTWKGKSAIHMAEALRRNALHQSRIFCVDTFLGSLEMWTRRDDPERYQALKCVNGFPTIYQQFLANVIHTGFEDMIIPFPNTSTIAADWFRDAGFMADLIYIDAGHGFAEVLTDMNCWWENLRPGGVLFGDDWSSWPAVRRAVIKFLGQLEREYVEADVVHGNKWVIRK